MFKHCEKYIVGNILLFHYGLFRVSSAPCAGSPGYKVYIELRLTAPSQVRAAVLSAGVRYITVID